MSATQYFLERMQSVDLVVGLFEDTLPGFVDTHSGPVSLPPIDRDLHSAAKTVPRSLGHRLVAGRVILFDE